MRTRNRFAAGAALLTALLLAVATASASPVNVQFVSLGGQNQNGLFTYPYYLTMDNGPWTAMMCDDFYDHISIGDMWQASVTDLSSHDVSQTLFGDLTKYEEAAFLLLQIKDYNSAEWANINWAIWEIFDPAADPGSEYQAGVNYWLNMAETTDLSQTDFSGVKVLTPIEPGFQEFIFTTPEPGTLLLLGSGLLSIAAWGRRRFS